jgi:hypothetical protein
LTWANKYTDTRSGNRLPIKGSNVTLIDDLGNKTILEEELFDYKWACIDNAWEPRARYLQFGTLINTGFYLTPSDFKAVIGRSYTLFITTPDEATYKSKPVTVLPVAPIDSIYMIPFSNGALNPLINSKGIDLMAKFKDDEKIREFYLWKGSNSQIELITEPDNGRTPVNCEKLCYIPDLNHVKFLGTNSDINFNGLDALQKVFSILDDGIRFKSRYRITIDQYSIDEEAYNFFKLVNQQINIKGSVFDPLPANIRGNMLNIENPEKQVLGYFVIADVSSKTIYIDKAEIPFQYRAVPQIIPRCCTSYCGGLIEPPTLVPPDDWVY